MTIFFIFALVQVIQKCCPRLKKLMVLHSCSQFTVSSASLFPKSLVSISLSYNSSATDSVVTKIAQTCPALECVNLCNCKYVTSKSVRALAVHCKGLKSICLTLTGVGRNGFEALVYHNVSLHNLYMGECVIPPQYSFQSDFLLSQHFIA